MSLTPDDYVGWTVTVHENEDGCPVGIFYCTGTWLRDDLVIAQHGAPRDACGDEFFDPTYWVSPKYCSRLRQGDFAP